MNAEYYAGKWNDHSIVFALGKKQTLLFDGNVIAEGKPLSTGLTGDDPTEAGSIIRTLYDGRNCFCIAAKPLETSYDKKTKTYSSEYYGHKIEGNSQKMNYSLFVNGEEKDKKEAVIGGGFSILGSEEDENGKRIMAVFEPSGLSYTCRFYAEAENVRMVPCQKQGGELIPINPSDGDGFAAGFLLGLGINL